MAHRPDRLLLRSHTSNIRRCLVVCYR
jgi:hypothetical protein